MTHEIVIASHNQGKLNELQETLNGLPVKLYTQGHFNIAPPDEPHSTFVENALLKARHVCETTGRAAIADDSGLQVDALGGQPGVRSARYSGAHGDDQANIQRLLDELAGIPMEQRTARFHCLTVYLTHPQDPGPILCEGVWEGLIALEPRGEFGFGYDPVFYVPEQQCTAGEMDSALKNTLSHRSQALACLMNQLQRQLG